MVRHSQDVHIVPKALGVIDKNISYIDKCDTTFNADIYRQKKRLSRQSTSILSKNARIPRNHL
jgi:hypothetical protein